MSPWSGRRPVAVVTACTSAAGLPDFALTRVDVTHPEYEGGVHLDLVAQRLTEAGYQGPFIHFDEADGPAFLFPAVKRYLGRPA